MTHALVVISVKKVIKYLKKSSKVSAVSILVWSIDDKTVLNHLRKAGHKKKLDIWVPHELSVKNMIYGINICDTLLKSNQIEPFLKRIITGDEKWMHHNRKCKRSCKLSRSKDRRRTR